MKVMLKRVVSSIQLRDLGTPHTTHTHMITGVMNPSDMVSIFKELLL